MNWLCFKLNYEQTKYRQTDLYLWSCEAQAIHEWNRAHTHIHSNTTIFCLISILIVLRLDFVFSFSFDILGIFFFGAYHLVCYHELALLWFALFFGGKKEGTIWIYAAYKKTTGTNKTFNAIFINGAADGLPKQQSFCLVLQKKIGKIWKKK